MDTCDLLPSCFDDHIGDCNYYAIHSNSGLFFQQSKQYILVVARIFSERSSIIYNTRTNIAHAIHNVFQTGNGTTLEVRAGYMGICVTQSHIGRICSTNAQVLANLFQAQKHVKNGTSTEIVPDPLNLIMIANEFKEKIVFDGLIYIVIALMFICILILSSFPGWNEEVDDSGSIRMVRPFPSMPLSQICLLGFLCSSAFCLISVLWQHINSSAAATMTETLTYGAVSAHVGGAAMALGWLSVGLIAVVSIGILVMILSISILRKLMEDD
ncbi:hypothetical protein N7447_005035 [Penicillium robsamsonii]|uniref:uncharacterized protein n=1 Tax=Penicillium robsamsonii TaxID=1792511 RepID=UPI0025498D60|nr:uncharacterized protein N7447_005035 [Penicillium robsamsonii]KAJ5822695.1 hypothetical protein N7447_005035 [Penicillium robsamsonii]